MLSGVCGVGFSRLTFFQEDQGPYIIKVRFTTKTALCAYYVLSRTECDFIHKAEKDIHALALDYNFIHHNLFDNGNRYAEQYEMMKQTAWNWHRNNIYNKCAQARKDYLDKSSYVLRRNRITIKTKDKMIALQARGKNSIEGGKKIVDLAVKMAKMKDENLNSAAIDLHNAVHELPDQAKLNELGSSLSAVMETTGLGATQLLDQSNEYAMDVLTEIRMKA